MVPMLAFSVSSQTFSVATESQTASGSASDNDIYEVVLVKNETTSDITLSWERFDEDLPSGWTLTSCDPCGCRPESVTELSGCVLTPDKLNGYVNIHFYPHNVDGTGSAKTRLWDESTMDEITVTFTATASKVLGVVETENAYLRAYPNPFSETLNLEFNYGSSKNISLELLDLLGKVVMSKHNLTSKETVTLNSELGAGIYFCVIKSGGRILDRIKVKKI